MRLTGRSKLQENGMEIPQSNAREPYLPCSQTSQRPWKQTCALRAVRREEKGWNPKSILHSKSQASLPNHGRVLLLASVLTTDLLFVPFGAHGETSSIQPASESVLPLQSSHSTDADVPLKHLPTAIVQHVATCSVKPQLYYTYLLLHVTTSSKTEFPLWKLEIPNFTSNIFFLSECNEKKNCCENLVWR